MGILVKFQLNISHQELNLSSVGSKIWMKVVSKNNHRKMCHILGHVSMFQAWPFISGKPFSLKYAMDLKLKLKLKKYAQGA